MKIYIAHSKDFDYINELYIPIRNHNIINKHEIILPHEEGHSFSHTRDFYQDIDLMIAECSYPSTGLGIELGWVFDNQIPIYCVYKKGQSISQSISAVTSHMFEYTDVDDMLHIISDIITKEEK